MGNRGSQLQQDILNTFTNAADAMRTIDDRTKVLRVKSRVVVEQGDDIDSESGPAIEQKNADRIFDVFFTTKSNGMGMVWRFADRSLKLMTEFIGKAWRTPRFGYPDCTAPALTNRFM